MEFKRFTKKVELLRPPDFQLDAQEVEYREDPLTNSRCIINIRRAERVKQEQKAGAKLDGIIQWTRKGCFFCPEEIEVKTPRFPPSLFRQGKIKRGECVVFPNLFPFAEYHVVATLTAKHFLDLDQFEPQMLVDSILACQEWMLSVYRKDKEAKHPIYIWNYMPPSAASIVHPHIQAIVRQTPTAMQKKLLEKSEEYFRNNGRNYWEDLGTAEKELDERYIGENDSLTLIASFAPRGFREIQFIFHEGTSFTDLSEKQVRDFADSLVKILRGYKEMGVGSFNLITFSGPIGERLDYYLLNMRIISRPFPRGVYANDSGPLEKLQDEPVVETLPEDVARGMKAFFNSGRPHRTRTCNPRIKSPA